MDSNATFNGTFNGTFDPYQQKVIITLLDHSTVRPTIADLDDFYFYSVHISINYGAQLGASLMLLVVLFLTTKKDKCLTPVFLLNVLSLAINFVRLALMCFYFGGPWSEIYAAFTGDFSAVPASAYNTSYVAIVLSLILLAVIQASLFLQMHVVCFDLRKRYRQALAVMAVVVGMIAIGFHFAFAMQNILSVRDGDSMAPYQRLDSAVNITTTISICWFCAVFVGKLGYSLRQRRKLGLKKFSPMEIIFVGGCQTLLVPGKHHNRSHFMWY